MRLFAIFTALALSLLGCGGSGSDTDPGGGTASPTTNTTSTLDTAATTATAQTPTTNGGFNNDSFSSANCPEFVQWAADAAAATQAAFTGGGTNAAGIAFTADYFQKFADQSPSVIRDDMQVFADAFSGFYDTLGELNIDFTDPASFAELEADEIRQLEAAGASMNTAEVEQATNNVRAFFETECS